MNKILLVEDDPTIAEIIKTHLESWDYQVCLVQDYKNVVEEFKAAEPQLVLLDIALPFFNGYHWCEEIRKRSKVPILFLSSASDNMNIVMAMNMGADDFIAKPFDLAVLTAKIQAMLRRTYTFNGEAGMNILERNGAILNLGATVLEYNGEKIELTKNDLRILEILMENAGHVVSREEIMTRLWESDSFIDDNTLTVNVTRLRKKLEEHGLTNFILTKKGLGYIIA